MDHDDRPIAHDAYETLAEPFAACIDTKPHNAYYERPATLSLLPEVDGRRVLDAGCGPGVYTEWLLDHGAEVVGLDASPKMIRLAKERIGDRAEILQADLGRPLDFLADCSFDLVLSALTLDYVRDWERLFGELHRLLRPAGRLVFSVGHPYSDWVLSDTERYFERELIEYEWKGFGAPIRVPCYRRPLEMLINPLLAAGFALEHLVEPQPTPEFESAAPEDYARLCRRPGFLCIRAQRL